MSRPRFRQTDGRKEIPHSYEPILMGRPQSAQRKKTQPTLIMNLGRTYTQYPGLPPLPGQFAFFGDPVFSQPPPRSDPHASAQKAEGVVELYVQPIEEVPQPGHYRQKKINQWERWQNKVIPDLVRPYLLFLLQSQSLSRIDDPTFPVCTCGSKSSKLDVVILSFTYLKKCTLRLCKCLPTAPQQLIAQGFFPCAPVKPSIAVDIRVLDFANRLFLYMPPNNTAWCNALEDFFLDLGWKLETKDSLRRRFENSLRWFITLKQTATATISNEITCTRPSVAGWTDGVKAQDSLQFSISQDMSHILVMGGDPGTSTVLSMREGHSAFPCIGDDVTQGDTISPLQSSIPRHTPHVLATGRNPLNPTVPSIGEENIIFSRIGVHISSSPLQSVQRLDTTRPLPRSRNAISLIAQRDDQSMTTNPTSLSSRSFQTSNQSASRLPSNAGDSTLSSEQPTHRKRGHSEVSDSVPESVPESIPASNPFPEPRHRDRPSDYLRERCPLCFGGEYPPRSLVGPHAILCVDACFTQKRNKGERDPERTHPQSLFVSEQDAINMQQYVDHVRPPKTSKSAPKPAPNAQKKAKKNQDEEPMVADGYEGPIQVPTSVLNGCEASFKAADEQREKASTQFFDDTGLMALLCRHDRVLWVVNLRSAGEKQHYVLVLLEILFQHLPLDFLVGLLYDIGCQLHRSCIKWGFLDRYLHRISFAISVFHAFGHQWPCQIIYHPRKREGFGLSDGEGCERFWHSISKLIPVLRVSGYHQRIYTLDSQVHHLDFKSLERLAHWLLRRKRHCGLKLLAAEKLLKESVELLVGEELLLLPESSSDEHEDFQVLPEHEDFLRDQWNKQVIAQTRPLPRRSKTQGKSAVQEVIRLRNAYETINTRVRELGDQLASSDQYIHAMAATEILEARQRLAQAYNQLSAKQKLLGVKEDVELKRLMNNPYINLRMNALAIKMRLRDRLRLRKFELDPIERMVRRSANARKLQTHTESSVERRDPTIKQLARTYNSLCDQLLKLIDTKKAPAGSIPPHKIPTEGLFSLDVDDEIWRDAGLMDDNAGHNASAGDGVDEVPLWLGNDSVRSGIKALLERDRCLEEESRLEHERRAMQTWFNEEWKVLGAALDSPCDEGSRYQIYLRRKKLCSLYAVWLSSAQQISPGNYTLPPWGPSPEELLKAQVEATTPSYLEEELSDNNCVDHDNDVTVDIDFDENVSENEDLDSSSSDICGDQDLREEEGSSDEFNEMGTAFDMASMAYYEEMSSGDDL